MDTLYKQGKFHAANLEIEEGEHLVKITDKRTNKTNYLLPQDLIEPGFWETSWQKDGSLLHYYTNTQPETYWKSNIIINQHEV